MILNEVGHFTYSIARFKESLKTREACQMYGKGKGFCKEKKLNKSIKCNIHCDQNFQRSYHIFTRISQNVDLFTNS